MAAFEMKRLQRPNPPEKIKPNPNPPNCSFATGPNVLGTSVRQSGCLVPAGEICESRCDIIGGMTDVTQIISQIEKGDCGAAERLLPLVYNELRKLAAAKLAQEKPGQTLQATALVHDAYLRLVGPADRESPKWENQGHFFAAAAEAMRRILVEQARRKSRIKRGGEWHRVDLDSACAVSKPPSVDLLALDEALTKFAINQPIKAELVKLRFFAGLTMPEAAAALGMSLATAERYWTFARNWLYMQIAENGPQSS